MTVETGEPRPASSPSWRLPRVDASSATHPALTVVIPAAIAIVLWSRGRHLLAVAIVVIAVTITAASALSPAFGRGFHQVLGAIGRIVGTMLTTVLLGVVWLVVFVPVGLLSKLLRIDPLDHPEIPRTSRWQAHVPSDPKLYRHQFALERPRSAKPDTRWGRIRHGTAVAIVAVVVFALCDLGAGMVWDRIDPQDAIDKPHWERTEAHAGDSWAPEYYAAVRRREFEYDPARAFIPTDVSSRYLNVEGGVRRSYQATGAGASAEPVRIYFFGGSVMWGLGQRDDYTIPSDVARLAEQSGVAVEVRNYGQSAYSLWQEVRIFEELLTAGDVPDIAVFLDGYNDTIARYDWPVTDRETTTLEGDFRELLARGKAHRQARSPLGAIDAARELYANHSVTGRVWHSLFGRPQYRPKKPGAPSPDELAGLVARSYERSVELARRIGSSYGVETFFFWQPTAADKDELARGEQFVTGPKWTGFAQVWAQVTPRVTDVAVDLSDVYDGHPEAIFTDIVHTNERGAALVADRIWSVIELPVRSRAAREG